jgi:hypothetical protein
MKQKTSPKDLTRLLVLATAAFNAAAALIDLLSKVVNYACRIRKLRLLVQQR